jgi:hypothetical protein
VSRADREIGAGRADLPSDLPDDFEPERASTEEPASSEASLMEDLDALFSDGKTYLQAEVTYQKSRAGYAANRLKWTAIYGAAAFGLLHLALIALTVGVVIALTPLTGPWIATAIVVVLLLAGTLLFVVKLRKKLNDIRTVFEDGPA